MLAVAALGLTLVAGATLALRVAGADLRTARRLAGPREVPVGQLLDPQAPLPGRAVRVSGRIRCRDPLRAPNDERLVAFHRDVEVLAADGWRSIERLRETRSFALWDHDGSLPIDPAAAAEPLITIPAVWEGAVDALEEPHASSAARLAERSGPLRGARARTRTINVTDRLLVLAIAERDEAGRVRLAPPPGGYLITTLALDDAMRLLGGGRRAALAGATLAMGIGAVLAVVGVVGAVVVAAVAGS
jgi:hypothetical protein